MSVRFKLPIPFASNPLHLHRRFPSFSLLVGTMPMLDDLKKSASGTLDRAKLMISGGNEEAVEEQPQVEEPDRLEELAAYCPTLTWQERLIGFASSFSLGYLIAFFSFRFFIKLVEGHPLPFAVNYTSGHILQLLASMFLCGPKRQFKNMFDDRRRMTSTVYLSCLGLTIFIIFLPMPSGLKLLLLLVCMGTQFCASVWYSLSYIPYGRATALRLIKHWLGIEGTSSTSGGVVEAAGAYAGVMT